MVPALVNEHYIIRFAICAQNAVDEDIHYAWSCITQMADDLLATQLRETSAKEMRRLTSSGTSEEDEPAEEEVFLEFDKEIIYDNQQLNFQRARMRRNMFLRMVSDPKSCCTRPWKSFSADDHWSRRTSESQSEGGSSSNSSDKHSPKSPKKLSLPL
ncbi:TDC-1 [Acanthosepion pharaonis]|uniref:TDC-1 n=1 Tax=Acanthosepion pharaonis TaxID=158019 RepID=A0A812APH1_ACAPH|nr:TDC-1 [Sepia pharaonis]